MDQHKLRSLVFEKTGVRVDIDDPIFALVALNEAVLAEAVERHVALIDAASQELVRHARQAAGIGGVAYGPAPHGDGAPRAAGAYLDATNEPLRTEAAGAAPTYGIASASASVPAVGATSGAACAPAPAMPGDAIATPPPSFTPREWRLLPADADRDHIGRTAPPPLQSGRPLRPGLGRRRPADRPSTVCACDRHNTVHPATLGCTASYRSPLTGQEPPAIPHHLPLREKDRCMRLGCVRDCNSQFTHAVERRISQHDRRLVGVGDVRLGGCATGKTIDKAYACFRLIGGGTGRTAVRDGNVEEILAACVSACRSRQLATERRGTGNCAVRRDRDAGRAAVQQAAGPVVGDGRQTRRGIVVVRRWSRRVE